MEQMWYEAFHVLSFDYIVRACVRIFDGTFEAIFTDGRSDFLRMFVVVILFLVVFSVFRILLKKWR